MKASGSRCKMTSLSKLQFSFSTRISNWACASWDSRWRIEIARHKDWIKSLHWNAIKERWKEKHHPPPPPPPPPPPTTTTTTTTTFPLTTQREFTSATISSYFIFNWPIWLFSLQDWVCHYACNDDYSNVLSLDCRSFAAQLWLNVLKVLERQNWWHSS